jgi:hypothetical protein
MGGVLRFRGSGFWGSGFWVLGFWVLGSGEEFQGAMEDAGTCSHFLDKLPVEGGCGQTSRACADHLAEGLPEFPRSLHRFLKLLL